MKCFEKLKTSLEACFFEHDFLFLQVVAARKDDVIVERVFCFERMISSWMRSRESFLKPTLLAQYSNLVFGKRMSIFYCNYSTVTIF